MKYVIANWKMNMTLETIKNWLNEFGKIRKDTVNTMIIISPSAIHLPIVKVFADNYSNVKIATQDVSSKDMGAHTGEIGVDQIKEFCSFSIVGHSELLEIEEVKKAKATKCLDSGITPIVCSKNPEVEWKKLPNTCLLAWEDPANISQVGIYNEKPFDKIEKEIRLLIDNMGYYNVIYGGSVNESNSEKLAKIQGLRGVLVGNASLDPKTFWKIIENFENN